MELLVVVAILAVLIALILPALGASKYQAKVVTCMSRVRGMTVGVLVYANAYNSFYPDGPHGRRGPEHIYLGGTGAESYDLRDDFRDYFGTDDLHEMMMCPLAQDTWPSKYPFYPNIDTGDKSPYAFYFGQNVHDYNSAVGAHWDRGQVMLRVGDTWSPRSGHPDMKFNWLMSDFAYYNGFGGFGGIYMATTHRDAAGKSPSIGSYLDHNLGSRYLDGQLGNANFAKDDGSVINFNKVGPDSVWNDQMIGVRRQSTQSYFVPPL